MDSKKYVITFTGNRETNDLRINFEPDVTEDNVMFLYTMLLTAVQKSFERVLFDIPVLRPATTLEQEHHVYVFKDEELDNDLYKLREQLYTTLSSMFSATLTTVFPDVEYIQQTTKYQQEKAFDADPAEFEMWKAEVAAIAEKVRREDDEGKEEQAGETGSET